MRERRGMSMADLVPSPDELESRPDTRLVIVGVIALLLFAVMVLRLFTLQVVDAKSYRKAVNANQIRTITIPAPRGLVTTRSNTILVGNQGTQELVLSRQEAVQNPSVIAQVAALTSQTPEAVQKILADPKYDPYQPAPIMTDVPASTIQYLEEHPADFPGVSVQPATSRSYPQGGTTAAHILGYVGAISSSELASNPKAGYSVSSSFGKSGLEQFYQAQLRGTDGSQSIAVTSQGKVVGTVAQTPAKPGNTLVLNIDLGLQQYLEQVLGAQILLDRQTLDKRSNKYPPAINGAAIVMDPHTGAVLAMASYPTYDLTPFVNGITQTQLNSYLQSGALNNYATNGLYTPGSTFKLVTATASLQQGVMGADQYVNDTGTFTVQSRDCANGGAGCVFHDDEAGGVGYVNLPSALTVSSDYYFYNLGYLFAAQESRFGATPIQDTANAYGLGEPSGIDLAGESVGRVDSQTERVKLHAQAPKAFPNTTWYTGDNIEMAFGQGATAVTPLEMAIAYSTFVNGGTRYAPQLAAGVVTPLGRPVIKYSPRVTGHVALTPAITDPIMQGLLGVVNDPRGTAYSTFQQYAHLASSFVVGGKTGTASNAPGLEPNSWFVGFGPGTNPSYVVVTVIDQGGYGANAAAPVVAQVFNYLATNPVAPVIWPSPVSPPSATPPATSPPAGWVPPSTTTTTPTG